MFSKIKKTLHLIKHSILKNDILCNRLKQAVVKSQSISRESFNHAYKLFIDRSLQCRAASESSFTY